MSVHDDKGRMIDGAAFINADSLVGLLASEVNDLSNQVVEAKKNGANIEFGSGFVNGMAFAVATLGFVAARTADDEKALAVFVESIRIAGSQFDKSLES